MKKLGLLLALIGLVESGMAQMQNVLDSVVVSVLRLPVTAKETGRQITIISEQEIISSGASSIDEVLQLVGGVEVQSRGGFGVQGDILMRGSTYNQVLVLVNGMRIGDPLTGHFNSNIPVAVAEILRIEVLKGAASARYGADAVGGIINIVTKTFSRTRQKSMVLGELLLGENNLVDASIGVFQSEEKWRMSASASIKESKGQPISAVRIDTATTLEGYRTSFDIKTMNFSVSYDINPKLTLRTYSSFDSRSFDARYFYTTSPFDKSEEQVRVWWNAAELVRINAKGQSDINLSYRYGTDKFVFSPDFPSTNRHITKLVNLNVNHLYLLNDFVHLKFGGQLDERQIESNDRGDHKDLHYGLYAIGLYRKSKFSGSISLRGDYDDNFEFEFSPSANLSYKWSNWHFRTALGKSIRAADYTERFVSNNLINLTPGRSLGNPDLLAERAWSAEFGIDIDISPQWQWRSTVFSRTSDNLIDYILTPEEEIGSVSETGSLQEGESYFFATNIASAISKGIELESNVRLVISNDQHLNWSLGYTFVDTEVEDGIESVYLSSHARHLINSRLSYTRGRVSVGLNGLYKERMEQSAPSIDRIQSASYILVNANVGYNVLPNLQFRAMVRNALDEDYSNILGATMPGRWFVLGLRWGM